MQQYLKKRLMTIHSLYMENPVIVNNRVNMDSPFVRLSYAEYGGILENDGLDKFVFLTERDIKFENNTDKKVLDLMPVSKNDFTITSLDVSGILNRGRNEIESKKNVNLQSISFFMLSMVLFYDKL